MRRLFAVLLLLGCEKKADAPPAAAPAPPLFRTDRAKACAAFGKRAAPSMKNENGPMDQRIATECQTAGRITAANYGCLMSTRSADDVGACFSGGPSDAGVSELFTRDKQAACLQYAQHVIALMTEDLEHTMVEACMSSDMKEKTFDCVMGAKTDAEFKGCLGLSP